MLIYRDLVLVQKNVDRHSRTISLASLITAVLIRAGLRKANALAC